MIISAVNALTLSPALCAMVLSHGAPQGRIIRAMQGGITRMQGGYASVRRTPASRRLLTVIVIVLFAVATVWLNHVLP